MNTRDASVSMTKGVAIILMVMAHSHFSHFGGVFINMFHMPLFFFMSGYCFKESYLSDFKGYSWRRIKGAYWPCLKWGLLFLLLHNFFFSINVYNGDYGFQGIGSQVYSMKDILHHAQRIILGMNDAEPLLGGYWFLHCYFFASFIAYAMIWLCMKGLRVNPIWGLIVLLFLCVSSKCFHIEIHDYIGAREILASAFIVAGFLYKHHGLKWENHPLVFIPLGIGLVLLGTLFWPCTMTSFTWKKAIPYALSAAAGTLAVFSLCKALTKNGKDSLLLKSAGNHTLAILTWHFLCFKLVSLLIIGVYSLPISRLAEFPVIDEYAHQGWWILYLMVGIAIPLFVEWSLRNLCRNRH